MWIGGLSRTRRLVASSAVFALAVMLLPAASALATTDSLVCNGSNTVTYTPPLTNQPQDVSIHTDIDWNLCVSPSQPGLTSGGVTGAFPLSDWSCVTLLEPAVETLTVTWNTGQTSTYTSTYNSNVIGAVHTVTSVGVVVDGLFEDHTITTNYTGPALDILTCTAGLGTVSKIEQVATLAIAPV